MDRLGFGLRFLRFWVLDLGFRGLGIRVEDLGFLCTFLRTRGVLLKFRVLGFASVTARRDPQRFCRGCTRVSALGLIAYRVWV